MANVALDAKKLEKIQELRLIDDAFMNSCLGNSIEATQLVLRIVLDDPSLVVISVTKQDLMKNLLGRDIWLDIKAKDSRGQVMNLEIQRDKNGAGFKRARYHSSALDYDSLDKSQDFDELPITYVIFITETDVIGAGEPIYFIDRMITNINKPFTDDEHIIYVNGEDKNSETALGRLMHDFFCTNPDEMYYKELADRSRHFKQTEEGVNEMSSVIDEMIYDSKKEAVKNLISLGKLSLKEISKSLDIPLNIVEELAGQKSA